jgi:hypothetical protein
MPHLHPLADARFVGYMVILTKAVLVEYLVHRFATGAAKWLFIVHNGGGRHFFTTMKTMIGYNGIWVHALYFFWLPKKKACGKGKAGCYSLVPAATEIRQAIAAGWVFQPFQSWYFMALGNSTFSLR